MLFINEVREKIERNNHIIKKTDSFKTKQVYRIFSDVFDSHTEIFVIRIQKISVIEKLISKNSIAI